MSDNKSIMIITSTFSVSDKFESEVGRAMGVLPAESGPELRALRVTLGPDAPAAGWIVFRLDVDGDRIADWWFSHMLDPFALPNEEDASVSFRLRFLPWLEDIASGRSSTLGLEMEGPVGVLAAFIQAADRVRLVVIENQAILLDGLVGRKDLLQAFYPRIVEYWESTVAANWSQWALDRQEILAPWSLRSPTVEAVVAAG